MKKHICSRCGYVYDPDAGDPMSEVPPGTAFDELPPGWACPLCRAVKFAFDEMEQP
ncbi:MAG: rubredoxin [Thermodesulfobacteriota bacterium]